MRNKVNVERLLPCVDEALIKSGILQDGKGIPEPYYGYVANFGAAVINMGIKVALLYYWKDYKESGNGAENENKEENKEENKVQRCRVVSALESILIAAGTIKGLKEKDYGKSLKKEVEEIKDNVTLYAYTQKIVDASVALKLMMRTYPIIKTTSNDKNDGNN